MKRARDIVERIRCAILGEPFDLKMLKDAADEIARLRLTDALTVRWIPVTERLPDNDSVVLVWSLSNGLHLAYLDSLRQWRDGDDNPGKKITHWMPPPEPPEVTT